jgi:class 3 adenylate cyclase
LDKDNMEQIGDGTLVCSWLPPEAINVSNRPEGSGSKTIMCSVLFLDIVEYAQKPVTGQMILKDRFNAFLAAAICDVPVDDRIILDTGDGAAINFLGDVADALKSAVVLRDNLLNKGVRMEPPLLVRMGINLGPVRLIKDVNEQPNIVGDGINVAQRVMEFAEPGQILVSRSYYDAISQLSQATAELFHFQGTHTDKHLREHEVYAIGQSRETIAAQQANEVVEQILLKQSVAQRIQEGIQKAQVGFNHASPQQRGLYVGIIASILTILSLTLVKVVNRPEQPKFQPAAEGQVMPAVTTAVPGTESATSGTNKTAVSHEINKPASKNVAASTAATEAGAEKNLKARRAPDALSVPLREGKHFIGNPVQPEPGVRENLAKDNVLPQITTKESASKAGTETKSVTLTNISIAVAPWGEVYLDGKIQGISPPLNVLHVAPGNHEIEFRNTTFPPFSTSVLVKADQQMKIRHKFAN